MLVNPFFSFLKTCRLGGSGIWWNGLPQLTLHRRKADKWQQRCPNPRTLPRTKKSAGIKALRHDKENAGPPPLVSNRVPGWKRRRPIAVNWDLISKFTQSEGIISFLKGSKKYSASLGFGYGRWGVGQILRRSSNLAWVALWIWLCLDSISYSRLQTFLAQVLCRSKWVNWGDIWCSAARSKQRRCPGTKRRAATACINSVHAPEAVGLAFCPPQNYNGCSE
jgi:hypothetical protein